MQTRTVEVGDRRIVYACPNKATAWRVETLATKEPDTLEWIDAFDPTDVLMDIGANVGMYTIYAAGIRGVRVVAFEPEASNFALLLHNIRLNALETRVTAYPVAMTDRCGFQSFQLSALGVGGSGHTVGDELLNQRLEPRQPRGIQGIYGSTIDAFIEQTGIMPDHIKIDVDAIEHLIIDGAEKTLSDENGPRSVLCEINTRLVEHKGILAAMEMLGFDCTTAPGAVRSEGPFEGIGNHIFRRVH